MKKMLILSFSDLKRDPRVSKQIDYFAENMHVTTAGYQSSGVIGVTHLSLANSSFDWMSKIKYLVFVFLRMYDSALFCMPKIQNALQVLSKNSIEYDFIIANDSYAWPIAFRLKGKARMICDAHEYAPKEFEDSLKWRLLFQKLNYFICRKYLPLADQVLTVSEGIASEYEKTFKIKRPVVIMNTPRYFDIKPSTVDPQHIKLIHHGGAIRSRKIENMIEMMNYFDDRFSLNLMLIESDRGYLDELKGIAASTGKKINFLAPVPMREIVPYISRFDIGVYILEPTSFNNRFALPNKVFEFVQARLAVAIGPSPEMAAIVKKYDLGWIAEDFSGKKLANAVHLDGDKSITIKKNNSVRAASSLNSENEFKKYNFF